MRDLEERSIIEVADKLRLTAESKDDNAKPVSRWTRGDKTAIGTACATSSRIWYTLEIRVTLIEQHPQILEFVDREPH
jgi:hypothetical protein